MYLSLFDGTDVARADTFARKKAQVLSKNAQHRDRTDDLQVMNLTGGGAVVFGRVVSVVGCVGGRFGCVVGGSGARV